MWLKCGAQVEQMVPRERFDGVCHELEGALMREQQAQNLLNEQGQQLEQMGGQLHLQLSEDNKNQHTLGEAVHVSI